MPISFKNWKAEEFKGQINRTVEQRVQSAAILLVNTVKENISAPAPPPSEPGEMPHKRSGRLRASIAYEMTSDTSAVVGSNVEYAKYLELGTKYMAPREFLERTLDECREPIAQVIRGERKVTGA